MICPKCKAEIADNAIACPYCGRDLPENATIGYCSSCGTITRPDERICPECGEPIKTVSDVIRENRERREALKASRNKDWSDRSVFGGWETHIGSDPLFSSAKEETEEGHTSTATKEESYRAGEVITDNWEETADIVDDDEEFRKEEAELENLKSQLKGARAGMFAYEEDNSEYQDAVFR